jgi:SSS family solute:Na+ symporter
MITSLDLTIVFLYLVAVFLIATVFSIGQGVEGFLVNKRATKLFFLVVSIVSTNVGAGFFLSVAAEAYATGISFGVSIIMISTATALTFVAVSGKVKRLADAGSVHTIPELLTQRYESPLVGLVAAVITIAGYLFVTALQFVGIGAVGSVISGFNFSTILLVAGIVTVMYTAIGGIRSDLFADALSFVIMVAVLAIIVPFILTSDRVDFSTLPSAHLDLFAFAGVPFFVLSILLAAVSSFMFMELWQRVFAAESPETARRAFLISAFIQPLLISAGILLGLTASVLYKDMDKSLAIFKVMVDFLPPGLLGLGLVAVLAILMTTVNSLVVVGGSTLFTDIIKPRLANAGERSQLLWVRFLTVAFGFCALGMAFVLPDLVRLLLMGAFVMMPMCPAIIWSLLGRRPGSGAAVTSMVAGVAVTLVLLRRMPETAFGPGFLVSLLVLVVGYYLHKTEARRK